MAMFVILKSLNLHGKQNQAELHIPFANLPQFVNEEIDFIQADGDELGTILSSFRAPQVGDNFFSIPVVHVFGEGLLQIRRPKAVQRWYGDIAKTIYFNLG